MNRVANSTETETNEAKALEGKEDAAEAMAWC